jgi:hypothetical protein
VPACTNQSQVTEASCARFISRAVNAGKRVLDIGPAGREATSPFYKAEMARLTKLGLERVRVGEMTVKNKVVTVYEWVRKK